MHIILYMLQIAQKKEEIIANLIITFEKHRLKCDAFKDLHWLNSQQTIQTRKQGISISFYTNTALKSFLIKICSIN